MLPDACASAMPLLGYFLNWCCQAAIFSFPITAVIPMFKTYHTTGTQLLQDQCSSSSNASHLSELWTCHPALRGCKQRDSPSSRLSGPRGPTRSRHTSDLSFWELEIGTRRSFYCKQQGISLSLRLVCISVTTGKKS